MGHISIKGDSLSLLSLSLSLHTQENIEWRRASNWRCNNNEKIVCSKTPQIKEEKEEKKKSVQDPKPVCYTPKDECPLSSLLKRELFSFFYIKKDEISLR